MNPTRLYERIAVAINADATIGESDKIAFKALVLEQMTKEMSTVQVEQYKQVDVISTTLNDLKK